MATCGGRQVQLLLTARKFFCSNLLCERKVFTERFPQLVELWARMTIRLCQQLTLVGLATCGKGGVRLAARLGIDYTLQTVLRRIMNLPLPALCSVLRLGIDDFSFRRGPWFGTILVSLGSHRIIDLLPDRRSETCAQWMQQRPEITIVSRDRGSEYAKAASQGAPQAIQIADRFHVCKNLTEATQLLLARCQAEIVTIYNVNDTLQYTWLVQSMIMGVLPFGWLNMKTTVFSVISLNTYKNALLSLHSRPAQLSHNFQTQCVFDWVTIE